MRFFEDSPSLVGELLGVSASTVRRWATKGVPAKWCGRPSHFVPRVFSLFESMKKSLEEEATFAELLKLAGEAQVLPDIRSYDGPREGEKTQGWRWTRRIQRRLSEEVLAEMAAWALSRRGKAPVWQIAVITSQYALTSRHGFGAASRSEYKTVIVQLAHVKAGDFAVERPEPTALHDSIQAATAEMVSVFEEMLADQELMVFIHAVTVNNYRKRSAAERKDWLKQQRYQRGQKKAGKRATGGRAVGRRAVGRRKGKR